MRKHYTPTELLSAIAAILGSISALVVAWKESSTFLIYFMTASIGVLSLVLILNLRKYQRYRSARKAIVHLESFSVALRDCFSDISDASTKGEVYEVTVRAVNRVLEHSSNALSRTTGLECVTVR